MALIVRWMRVGLCVSCFVFCGNSVELSNSDYYQYINLASSSDYSTVEIVLTDRESNHARIRRYLAGEDSSTGFRPAINEENSRDPGGSVGGGPVIGANVSQSGTNETGATRLSPATPADPNEPKTGGNYMSVHDAFKNSTAKSIADLNRTTPPKTNTSANAETSTQISSGQGNRTNSTLKIVTETPTTTTTLPIPTTTNASLLDIDDITAIANFTNISHYNYTYKTDHHIYYNSTFKYYDEELGKFYWVDMNKNNSNVVVNDMLSQSHRRAATVKLSFDFPFYGHIVRNVTVATGGFLYTGDYVHSWLAATQYIAPLMANFDTSLSNESFVKYVDNGTQFTVEWDKVKLQDRPESGMFTFQATLKDNGDIIFVYKSVPLLITSIKDDNHPVKVGLSDAYIIDRTILFVRRKTIYEYHRVTFEHMSITNWTVINLIALPTCLNGTDCEACLQQSSGIDCNWCPETNKCSSGVDRHRQEWLVHECDIHAIKTASLCPSPTKKSQIDKKPVNPLNPASIGENEAHHQEETVTALFAEEPRSLSVSALIGILFLIGSLMSLSLWVLYAYRNPHTASGQFLIKYRPSQWSWRRGEARYTAATIHM